MAEVNGRGHKNKGVMSLEQESKADSNRGKGTSHLQKKGKTTNGSVKNRKSLSRSKNSQAQLNSQNQVDTDMTLTEPDIKPRFCKTRSKKRKSLDNPSSPVVKIVPVFGKKQLSPPIQNMSSEQTSEEEETKSNTMESSNSDPKKIKNESVDEVCARASDMKEKEVKMDTKIEEESLITPKDTVEQAQNTMEDKEQNFVVDHHSQRKIEQDVETSSRGMLETVPNNVEALEGQGKNNMEIETSGVNQQQKHSEKQPVKRGRSSERDEKVRDQDKRVSYVDQDYTYLEPIQCLKDEEEAHKKDEKEANETCTSPSTEKNEHYCEELSEQVVADMIDKQGSDRSKAETEIQGDRGNITEEVQNAEKPRQILSDGQSIDKVNKDEACKLEFSSSDKTMTEDCDHNSLSELSHSKKYMSKDSLSTMRRREGKLATTADGAKANKMSKGASVETEEIKDGYGTQTQQLKYEKELIKEALKDPFAKDKPNCSEVGEVGAVVKISETSDVSNSVSNSLHFPLSKLRGKTADDNVELSTKGLSPNSPSTEDVEEVCYGDKLLFGRGADIGQGGSCSAVESTKGNCQSDVTDVELIQDKEKDSDSTDIQDSTQPFDISEPINLPCTSPSCFQAERLSPKVTRMETEALTPSMITTELKETDAAKSVDGSSSHVIIQNDAANTPPHDSVAVDVTIKMKEILATVEGSQNDDMECMESNSIALAKDPERTMGVVITNDVCDLKEEPMLMLQGVGDECSTSEGDQMMDFITDSQMLELDEQSFTPAIMTSASAFIHENCGFEEKSVQTQANNRECEDSTTVVQNMVRELKHLNSTVLDIKKQMDNLKRQRFQGNSRSYQGNSTRAVQGNISGIFTGTNSESYQGHTSGQHQGTDSGKIHGSRLTGSSLIHEKSNFCRSWIKQPYWK